MQILLSRSEIRDSKSKIQIFCVIFFNKDISVTTSDITMTFSMTASQFHPEGSVSQISYLGPSFFILWDLEKKKIKNITKVT